MFHTLGYPYLQLAHQFLGVVLYIVEYLGYRLTIDDLVDMIVTVFLTDMYGIGVTEEVVHIA